MYAAKENQISHCGTNGIHNIIPIDVATFISESRHPCGNHKLKLELPSLDSSVHNSYSPY